MVGFALIVEQGKPKFLMRWKRELSTVDGLSELWGMASFGWSNGCGRQHEVNVDGKLVSEGKSTKGLIPKVPANALSVGLNAGSTVGDYQAPFALTGIVDEVRLYFEAASADRIKQRFEDGSEVGENPHLVLTFDDESFRDLSLFNNNGTPGEGVSFVEGKVGMAAKFSGAKSGENQSPGTSLVKPKWANDVPIYVRAMALSGDLLFMAGPPDIIDEEKTFKQIAERDTQVQKLLAEQDDAILGRFGGQLLVVNAQSGQVVHKLELPTTPAWDGMALANERVYMTTLDGKVVCFGKP
ncbi:MAG: hypothetical protein U0930_13585 [Pirellulales bacterium]